MKLLEQFENNVGFIRDGEFDFLKWKIDEKLGRNPTYPKLQVVNTHRFGPIAVRPKTSDVHTLTELLHDGAYKIPEYFFEKFEGVGNDINIIDAGSNIGLASLSLGQQLYLRGQDPKIVAIEPDFDNLLISQINLTGKNQCTPQLVHGAIGKKSSTGKVYQPSYNGNTNSYRVVATGNNEPDPNTIEIFDMQTIMDTYFLNDVVHILKMDIEGSEFETINWEADWLKRVGIFFVETHERFYTGSNDSAIFDGVLENFGFIRDYNYSDGNNPNKLYANEVFLGLE